MIDSEINQQDASLTKSIADMQNKLKRL